jgi:acyl carrier protein
VIERELIGYISTEIAYDRAGPLAPDAQLLDGALDSLDILRLVVFVEERYSIRIDDDDLVPENFATVDALAGLLRGKGVN